LTANINFTIFIFILLLLELFLIFDTNNYLLNFLRLHSTQNINMRRSLLSMEQHYTKLVSQHLPMQKTSVNNCPAAGEAKNSFDLRRVRFLYNIILSRSGLRGAHAGWYVLSLLWDPRGDQSPNVLKTAIKSPAHSLSGVTDWRFIEFAIRFQPPRVEPLDAQIDFISTEMRETPFFICV